MSCGEHGPEVRACRLTDGGRNEEAALVYAAVAQRDTDHHFEALAFASATKEDAEKLRADV
jgi:hypothetical protein